MKTKVLLWKHQQDMVNFINKKDKALLVAGCGVGKTLTALASIQEQHKRVLIITVKQALNSVWVYDFDRFIDNDLNYKLVVLDKGTAKEKERLVKQALKENERVIIISNYETIYKMPFDKWGIDYIIADECHKLKNPTGVQSKAITKKSLSIPKKLAMSGTVWDRAYYDAFAQVRFLDAEISKNGYLYSKSLGTYTQFWDNYVIYYQNGYIKIPNGYKNIPALKKKLEQFVYIVENEKVLDLPEFHEIVRPYYFSDSEHKKYMQLETELLLDLGSDEVTVNNVLTKILRLRQFCNGQIMSDQGEVVHTSDAKLEALQSLLEEIDEKEPVVIFTAFDFDIELIKTLCDKNNISYNVLSGSVKEYDDWRVNDKRVLITQYQAGGVGLDLTKARYAIYYSLPVSNNMLIQTKYRVRRPNSRDTIYYYYLVNNKTVESDILAGIKTSENFSQYMYNSLKNKIPLLFGSNKKVVL